MSKTPHSKEDFKRNRDQSPLYWLCDEAQRLDSFQNLKLDRESKIFQSLISYEDDLPEIQEEVSNVRDNLERLHEKYLDRGRIFLHSIKNDWDESQLESFDRVTKLLDLRTHYYSCGKNTDYGRNTMIDCSVDRIENGISMRLGNSIYTTPTRYTVAVGGLYAMFGTMLASALTYPDRMMGIIASSVGLAIPSFLALALPEKNVLKSLSNEIKERTEYVTRAVEKYSRETR